MYENPSFQKVFVSYAITTLFVFFCSAIADHLGLYGDRIIVGNGTLSHDLFLLIQFLVVCVANGILHGFFYFGNLESSPIIKGLGLGSMIAVSYFLICVLGLNMFDVTSDSMSSLISALGGRMFEYCSGGLITAAISVSDLHKWGLIRSF